MMTYESTTRDALGRSVTYSQFYKMYKNEKGELHRVDGPAVVHADGSCEWWVDGKRHRTNGPAVVRADYYVEYWQNNKLHRIDGPAVIHGEGYQEWWINSKFIQSKHTIKEEKVMATKKKGILTPAPQWWDHLKDWKKVFWSAERKAVKKEIKKELRDG